MASVPRCAFAAAAAAAAAAAVPRRLLPATATACSSSSLLSIAAAPSLPLPSLLAVSAAPHAPILDFLLPSFAGRRCLSSTQVASRRSTRIPRSPTQKRPLSTQSTPSAATTRTLLNPQTDDDGHEMRLDITPRAAQRLATIMAKDANPRLALRIQVESGGCHGFQYVMSLVTLPGGLVPEAEADNDGEESVLRADDTVFCFSDKEDDPSAPKIILDTPSLELLRGSKVDFTTELIGSQFKITDNPLATSSCGCGTSFDIKV